MEVEFDPAKDGGNRRKHGLALHRTAEFEFESALFDRDDSQDYGEERFNAIGWLNGTLHALTFTPRDSCIRAISLRRATREERRRYEKQFKRE